MRRYLKLLAIPVLLALLSLPGAARACPSCSAAIPETSGAEEDDRVSEARAYNHSIYLMVSMPYLLLGAVGYMVYRGKQLPPAEEPCAN